MRPSLFTVVTLFLYISSAFAQQQTPAAPPRLPVTETYFGTAITDPYRYMENLDDTTVIAWIKAEGRYTRSLLSSMTKRAALHNEVSAFSASFDFVDYFQLAGKRTFYEERTPGSDNFDLVVREANGATRKIVDISALRTEHGGAPYALNYYLPSPNGQKVAVGVSAGGSEDATLSVYDVSSGKEIASPLPLARFGILAWTDDGDKLFVNLLAAQAPGAPPTAKYINSRVFLWDLHSEPVPILGGATPSRITVAPEKIPAVVTRTNAKVTVAVIENGVENEFELWTAPSSQATSAGAPWTALTTPSDEVTNLDLAGDRIYLLSHEGAPTFKVLMLHAGEPLSARKVIVPARADRLIESFGTASDGLYLRGRRGLYSELSRVPLDGGPEQLISLPFKGSIGEMFTDPTRPGATLVVQGWVHPPTVMRYQPAKSSFEILKLGSTPAGFDPAAYQESDLLAKASDGTNIPLSYVEAKGAKHPQIVLLSAYGSYGISSFAGFNNRDMVAMKHGVATATCHVRGGGELGQAWRLAGKDSNKPNTWRDLIACGQELVSGGYTSKDKLFIVGGSAGGITMGRAMEEAPDLFAGVIDEVPAANPVRQEFSPNGVPNIPEFGTVKSDTGFRNLLAMDSYLNVKDGTQYPAVMITTGLNDPRVASWEPAKFAARLRASGTSAPVLLRVDEDAGHGVGSTKSQRDDLYTDILTFMFWRARVPGWKETPIVQ